MALKGVQAPGAGSQGSGADAGGSSPAKGEDGPQRKGPGVAFAVGITLVVVASLVLVLFFAFWDFNAPSSAEEPVAEPVTADSVG